MTRRRVLVTGIGVVSPFGVGSRVFWENVSAGRTAARLIDSFDVSHLPTRFAAMIPESEASLRNRVPNQKALKTMSRPTVLGMIAACEAVEDSRLDFGNEDPYRVGTAMGVSGLGLTDLEVSTEMLDLVLESVDPDHPGQIDLGRLWKNRLERMHPLTPLKGLANMPTAHIAIEFGARGVSQTVATACTSSAQAIGEAYRHIRAGIADVIIVGGCDSMTTPTALTTVSALGILSTNNDNYRTASRPFDRHRDGFMLGEGAAVVVLEEAEHCRRRDREAYGEVIGYWSACDAFRVTDEPPEAWGSIHAMRGALQDAQISVHEVDYINAHGTGTPMNDKTETYAIKEVFGDAARNIAVSSTKSQIGHLVAAAGCVEFAACLLALHHQVLPPTINYAEPDPDCDLDCVPNTARQVPVRTILSNSFGFGGQNACLVARSPDSGGGP